MTNTQKIQRVSFGMSVLCLIGLVLLPLPALYFWLWSDLQAFAGSIPIYPELIGSMNRGMGLLVEAVPTGLLMWGVWHLRNLFMLYHQAVFFSEENSRRLHGFALMLVFSVSSFVWIEKMVSIPFVSSSEGRVMDG